MSAPKPPKASKKANKSLTIKQRVDLLLKEGVDHPEKWAAVHGYVEPSNYDKFDQDGHFNEVCFDMLRDHHLEETEFLFDVIRELVRRNELFTCALSSEDD